MHSNSSYHGKLSGQEAEQILMEKRIPCYLTRYSNNHGKYILSTVTQDKQGNLIPFHLKILIDNDEKKYEIDGTRQSFENIDELLTHYENHPLNPDIISIGRRCLKNEPEEIMQEQDAQQQQSRESEQDNVIKLIRDIEKRFTVRQQNLEQQLADQRRANQEQLAEQRRANQEQLEEQRRANQEQLAEQRRMNQLLAERNTSKCTIL